MHAMIVLVNHPIHLVLGIRDFTLIKGLSSPMGYDALLTGGQGKVFRRYQEVRDDAMITSL